MRRGGEDVEIVSTGCRPPSVPRPGRCREDVEIVSTGCRPPSVPHPWMLLLHMQETALWIPPVCCVLDDICKRQLCGFPQWGLLSSRGGGPDTLAPVLQVSTWFLLYKVLCIPLYVFFSLLHHYVNWKKKHGDYKMEKLKIKKKTL